MNKKLLTVLIISLVLGVILIAGGTLSVIKYYPEYVGLQPLGDTLDVDTLYIEPTIEISPGQYAEFQQAVIHVAVADSTIRRLKRDSLDLFEKLLDNDTALTKLNESIAEAQDTLSKSESYSSKLNDSLNKMNKDVIKKDRDLKRLNDDLSNLSNMFDIKIDSLTTKNFKDFAKIYDKAQAGSVAQILERIDERDAAMILKNMQKKKAGKVLEAMNAERAAAILLLGAE